MKPIHLLIVVSAFFVVLLICVAIGTMRTPAPAPLALQPMGISEEPERIHIDFDFEEPPLVPVNPGPTNPPINSSMPLHNVAKQGGKLVLWNSVNIPANSESSWHVTEDGSLVYVFFYSQSNRDRVLQAGTELSILHSTCDSVQLPGNRLSTKGAECVCETTTQGGTKIFVLLTAGHKLTLVEDDGLTKYTGAGRPPTIMETRPVFTVILPSPEVIRATTR